MQSDPLDDLPPAEPKPWPWWQLGLFRFALLYYALYAFPGPIGALVRTFDTAFELGGKGEKEAPRTWITASTAWVDQSWEWLTTKMAALGVAPYEVIHQPTG